MLPDEINYFNKDEAETANEWLNLFTFARNQLIRTLPYNRGESINQYGH